MIVRSVCVCVFDIICCVDCLSTSMCIIMCIIKIYMFLMCFVYVCVCVCMWYVGFGVYFFFCQILKMIQYFYMCDFHVFLYNPNDLVVFVIFV